jgi:hypothetical protein
MKAMTIFKAMEQTVLLMNECAERRRGQWPWRSGYYGIAVQDDFLAKRWQRRNRQHARFRDGLVRKLEALDGD